MRILSYMEICIEIKSGGKKAFACSLLPEYYKKYNVKKATFQESEIYWKTKPLFDNFKHSVRI